MPAGSLLRLARPLAFLIGIAFSLLAIYSYAATAQLVIRNPALVLPDNSVWTVEQLQNAQAELSGNTSAGLRMTNWAVAA